MHQKSLSDQQIEAFYHEEFVADQTRDFLSLVTQLSASRNVVVDIGGGCGFFAASLARRMNVRVRVIDSDPVSVTRCGEAGVEAAVGDALAPDYRGDEEVVCFNLILHHLVGSTGSSTREMQQRALSVWRTRTRAVFVNEYIYESFVGTLSGALIYAITSSKILSAIGRLVSRVVPAFRANTFGVGVRFRAHDEWIRLFRDAGFEVVNHRKGNEERVSPALRLLLIRSIRRDSFLLRARLASQTAHQSSTS